jgi:rod shape-determining protein MreC
LFKQGPSALSKLLVFGALGLFLMVADWRFAIVKPMRSSLVTVLYPLQWLMTRPTEMATQWTRQFQSLDKAQQELAWTHRMLVEQSDKVGQMDQLTLENERLRALLNLNQRINAKSMAAQVLYDAADPFTRKIVIDKGLTQGVAEGSPVLDEYGIMGQVTRVHPMIAEVTLLIDKDQAIPVLNTRTGVRGVAYGSASAGSSELELRFMAGNADVEVGDSLSTSGVDGIYPPGLQVAKVTHVERRAESSFARVLCLPYAHMQSAYHVLVLEPVGLPNGASPLAVASKSSAAPATAHTAKGSLRGKH